MKRSRSKIALEKRRVVNKHISDKTLYMSKEDFNKVIENEVKYIFILEMAGTLSEEHKGFKDEITKLIQ